jgi:adenylyl-sulfate kinase
MLDKPTLLPKKIRGMTFLLTGLPAAGKSTLARALAFEFHCHGFDGSAILDGDEIRAASGNVLGFDRPGRREQLRRVTMMAREISQAGRVAICALIAPFAEDRSAMRQSLSDGGDFFEVFVSTPLEVCEKRDPKGLYARARNGQLDWMTGIDSPYEIPCSPDFDFDLGNMTACMAARAIYTAVSSRSGPQQG